MPEKLLIINADDYGLTPDVSRGIRHAHTHGIVTSTTALMNSAAIEMDLKLARQETPDLGVGVHLNLTLGKPLSPAYEIPSIVDQNGNFMSLGVLKKNVLQVNSDHIYNEWKAQIEKMITLSFNPDHLDSHHHVSFLHQGLYDIMMQLADDYALPVRTSPANLAPNIQKTSSQTINGKDTQGQQSPNPVRVSFYKEGVTVEHLGDILTSISPGIVELMVHPAFNSRSLQKLSSYTSTRELELAILTSPKIKNLIEQLGITLATFKALKNLYF